MALYRAKGDGKGTFRFFEPGMDARARQRRQLEIDLRAALKAGALEVHYQPLVELATGAITGCEALVRWHHAEARLGLAGRIRPGRRGDRPHRRSSARSC